jgi:O-methyltransferase
MKERIKNLINKLPYIRTLHKINIEYKHMIAPPHFYNIHERFKEFTMTPQNFYVINLSLAYQYQNVEGCIVECGTWKGGMIAGIAYLFKNEKKNYYLFDSFEGLPDAIELDGSDAINFKDSKSANEMYNNCKTDIEIAKEAMRLSEAKNVLISKGWFNETLPNFPADEKIAILRLDGDWYESTMDCLIHLYDKVVEGGLIIIDDYYAWEGCSKAVHDFLSHRKLSLKIKQFQNQLAYIEKIEISPKNWTDV